ncbi:hydrogenase nickel incorporation protein HypA/HybF [Anaerocolumna jejuensis DSM 15929]|uniref:Hydrogenase maturation factor HypA n=1 Tax=Anaerocolumna jejuensis DSM 15929 TaxID=1121322 RepID=A0A1M7A5A6_9FIRM|nr:hydrogenase maturation nickel metallochaperone HypA [Anaerocolumna jejuensis]SHL37907.1 hydrogenase nickel incorporation protein HypA/HybF [Anaerocolumna jejuensis DSM 15929]
MHELNVMLQVVDEVEQIASANQIPKVSAIVLDVGELCSIIPSFMIDYFPLMIEDKPMFEDCKLIIERSEGIGKCKTCGADYNVVQNGGFCPVCHEYEKEVLSGRDFLIKEIQILWE